MPSWGRSDRRVARQIEQYEQQTRAAAREAVSRVTSCFVSDPETYEVRAAIVVAQGESDLVVWQLVWDDDNPFLSEDPRRIVRDHVPAQNEAEARQLAEAWVGESACEVSFHELPGLYQESYARSMSSGYLPTDALRFMWVLPDLDSDEWVVRLFPSGIGKHAPPVGEVGFVRMPRVAIEEMWRSRGW